MFDWLSLPRRLFTFDFFVSLFSWKRNYKQKAPIIEKKPTNVDCSTTLLRELFQNLLKLSSNYSIGVSVEKNVSLCIPVTMCYCAKSHTHYFKLLHPFSSTRCMNCFPFHAHFMFLFCPMCLMECVCIHRCVNEGHALCYRLARKLH